MENNANKQLMLIEVNEFSLELFELACREIELPSISKMLRMKASVTTTDDLIEHRGLDPWVQWVSVHTGTPSSTHGIFHLGDTPTSLSIKQLWQVLSYNAVSSGVWGAMNATRDDADKCEFFLPDPWTFSEDAYPDGLNNLLSLPRYYSKNYLDVSISEFLKRTFHLTKYVVSSGAFVMLIMQVPLILRGLLKVGINNAVLFSLFDLFSSILFIQEKRKVKPQFTLIFLNSIAHLQHHKWNSNEKLNEDMKFGLRVIDKVLELLFRSLAKDEAIIIMNALTQRNIVGEKPRICYRQINPAKFLTAVGLRYARVEQLMTNDAHVFFENNEDRNTAVVELSKIKIFDKYLFQVEVDAVNPLKLFYQIDFWDELVSDISLVINDTTINFSNYFDAIVARTGAHTQNGNVFSSGINIPKNIYNHEITKYIYNFFSIKKF